MIVLLYRGEFKPEELKLAMIVLAIILLTILVMVLEIRAGAQTPQKQAYAVCSGKCLKSAALSPDSELVAPLIDGHADYKHGVLSNVAVEVDHSYEKIELRPAP